MTCDLELGRQRPNTFPLNMSNAAANSMTSASYTTYVWDVMQWREPCVDEGVDQDMAYEGYLNHPLVEVVILHIYYLGMGNS